MEGQALREILDLYEDCTGQCVNLEKSAIMFSPNTKEEVKDSVKNALQIHSESWSEKYLGLPSVVGKSKEGCFKHLRECSWSKLSGWKGQALSKAAREVLVKSVLQAIPAYSMSCFKFSKKTVREPETHFFELLVGSN